MSWRRLGDLALIMLVFVLVGPLVGLVVTALGIGSALAVGNGDLSGGGGITAFLLLYGFLFAHFVGVVPAIVSGLLVCAWAYSRGRVPIAVGALAGLASFALLNGSKFGPTPDPVGATSSEFTMMAVVGGAHILAAVVCTRLTRRWQ